jgi:hypothetical protein
VRSALRAGHPLHPGRVLVLISVRGWAASRAIVRLDGLGQLKNPVISSWIEPATFGRQYIRMGTRFFQVAYMAYHFSMRLHWILYQCHMKLLTDRWVRQYMLRLRPAVFTCDDAPSMWARLTCPFSITATCARVSRNRKSGYAKISARAYSASHNPSPSITGLNTIPIKKPTCFQEAVQNEHLWRHWRPSVDEI